MRTTEQVDIEGADPGPFGSSFDNFLAEHGILEECTTHAVKAVFVWQLEEARKNAGKTKSEFARMMGTSRSQVDRLLDPDNDAVTLEVLERAAVLLGKHVRIELVDAEQPVVAEVEATAPRL